MSTGEERPAPAGAAAGPLRPELEQLCKDLVKHGVYDLPCGGGIIYVEGDAWWWLRGIYGRKRLVRLCLELLLDTPPESIRPAEAVHFAFSMVYYGGDAGAVERLAAALSRPQGAPYAGHVRAALAGICERLGMPLPDGVEPLGCEDARSYFGDYERPTPAELTELSTRPKWRHGERIRLMAWVRCGFETSHLDDGTGDWPGLNADLHRIWVAIPDRRAFLTAAAPQLAGPPTGALARRLWGLPLVRRAFGFLSRPVPAADLWGSHGPLVLTGRFRYDPKEAAQQPESDQAVYRRLVLKCACKLAARLTANLEAVYGRRGLRNRALADVWVPVPPGGQPLPSRDASAAILCELADETLCKMLALRLRRLTDEMQGLGEAGPALRPLEALLAEGRRRLAGPGEGSGPV